MTIQRLHTVTFHGKDVYELTAMDEQENITGHCVITDNGEYLKLGYLYVAELERQKGVATGLVKDACRRADERKLDLYLEVGSYMAGDVLPGLDDDQLRNFYAKHGFVPVPGHPFAMVRPWKVQG